MKSFTSTLPSFTLSRAVLSCALIFALQCTTSRAAQFKASSLAPRLTLGPTDLSAAMAVGDLTGDGKPDLITAGWYTGKVYVFPNTAESGSLNAGSFGSPIEFVCGSVPHSVAVGDLDGDGKLDVVVANESSGSISILRNVRADGAFGPGSLSSPISLQVGASPRFVTVADLDGDGKLDIIVANNVSASISIFRNLSTDAGITTDSFAPRYDLPAVGSYCIAVGDLNGDGKPELVVADAYAPSVSVFMNTSTTGSLGADSFAPKIQYPTGNGPLGVVIADFDGDGKPDIATANANVGSMTVLRNTVSVGGINTSAFATRIDFESEYYPYYIVSGDLDGDGRPDLAVANAGAGTITLYRNTSADTNISFQSKVSFEADGSTRILGLADFDGDGKLDLASSSFASGFLSVFRNTISNATNQPPVISGQPQGQTVLRGATVTFHVAADGSDPLYFQWMFNEAPISGATAPELTLSNVQLNQAGSYSVVVSNALGTLTSSNAVLVVNPSAATVRVVNANGAGSAEMSVPVELMANGNENAIGFSLSFNPSQLSFVGASLGLGAPGDTALIVNTNDVAAGRLGLVVGLAANQVFSEGTQQLALITFLVAPILNETTISVNFADQPTLRQLSDVQAHELPAYYFGGTMSIANSQFEGDAAPRPNGNRSLATIDWVQMGRFVARLDAITNANEFQRADCAPRGTKGNGQITASDWVQAGRYAVGLDPVTVLGGPTEESGGGGGEAGFMAAAGERQLSFANTSVVQGQTTVVPVTLACEGNENATSFSVLFDPTKLAFVSATRGAGAPGGVLNLNTSEAAQGRIGVAMAVEPGTTFSAGTHEILQLGFAALVAAPATATLSFGNAPVPREVSGVTANSLATEYTANTISITLPLGPTLRATRTGNSLYITWPSSATGFHLEGTAGALGTAWSQIDGVIDLGEQKLAIVPIGSGERYFRLKKP